MTRGEIVQKIGSVIDRFPTLTLCLLFGSAVDDSRAPGSDVDIAVAAEEPLDEETIDRLRTDLGKELSADVDLLDLWRADGLILRESLVNAVYVRVHDDTLLARFISKMLFYEADMMPNFRMIVESAARMFVDEERRHSR